MNQQVTLFHMFPDYEPPEELQQTLSQAAIVAADIDPEERSVSVAIHAESYIPQRLLDQVARDITFSYGLRRTILTATHPETELHRIEEEELMQLFVSRNSMTRGSLAGAKWEWNGTALTVRLRGNGKKELEELLPSVQQTLRQRFACPVTIAVEAGQALEGKALFEAMESMRGNMIVSMPAVQEKAKAEAKAAAPSDAFYGKPFKGNPVPMNQMTMDMGTIIVEGVVFNVDHKELKKRNAWVIKFDMTDNTNSVRISRFMEAGEAKPILENVKVGSVLRVQGRLMEDRFENEMVMKPFAMASGSMPRSISTRQASSVSRLPMAMPSWRRMRAKAEIFSR